jgi:hypothetical protein
MLSWLSTVKHENTIRPPTVLSIALALALPSICP